MEPIKPSDELLVDIMHSDCFATSQRCMLYALVLHRHGARVNEAAYRKHQHVIAVMPPQLFTSYVGWVNRLKRRGVHLAYDSP